MKKFLAVFTVNSEKMAAFNQNPDAQQISIKEVTAWHHWMEVNKVSIVENGKFPGCVHVVHLADHVRAT